MRVTLLSKLFLSLLLILLCASSALPALAQTLDTPLEETPIVPTAQTAAATGFLSANTAEAQGILGSLGRNVGRIFSRAPSTPIPRNPGSANAGALRTPSLRAASVLTAVGMYEVIFKALSLIIKWIAVGILTFFALLLSWSGVLLNFAVEDFVIKMPQQILRGGFGGPINDLWKVIRDLVNISLIFALIYIGISTIVGSSSGVKKLLASVIISALLVNFSLYFTKVIIDASNLTATTIYNAMPQSISGGMTTGGMQDGIAGTFIASLGAGNLIFGQDTAGFSQFMESFMADETGGVGRVILYALAASVLMFKLTFAFAFAAILLLIRFIALIFLMITSPVAFIPTTLPYVGEFRKRWLEALIGHAFMAPVFLFGMYLTLYLMWSVPGMIELRNEGVLKLIVQFDNAKTLGTLVYFVMGVMLIIITTAIAKSLSEKGGSYSVQAVGFADKKLKTYLTNISTRPMKSVAQSTADKRLARPIRGALGKTSKSFEAWNRKQMGLDKTGKSSMLWRASKVFLDDEEREHMAQWGQKVTLGRRSFKDDQEIDKKYRKMAADSAADIKAEEKRDKGIEKLNELLEAGIQFDPKNQEEIMEMVASIRKMTKEQIEHLKQEDRAKYAAFFSDQQMGYIKESTDISPADKDATRDRREADTRRFASITGTYGPTLPNTGDALLVTRTRERADLLTLPAKTLIEQNIAQGLTQSEMDDIRKGKAHSEAEKDQIETARTTALSRLVDAGVISDNKNFADPAKLPTAVLERMAERNLLKQSDMDKITAGDKSAAEKDSIKEKWKNARIRAFRNDPAGFMQSLKSSIEVAKLPADILTDARAADHIQTNDLKKIAEERTLSVGEMRNLATHIRNLPAGTNPAQGYINSPEGQTHYGV